MDITKKISEDMLRNVFITALEGGSNYWYKIDDANSLKVRRSVQGNASFSEKLFNAVYHNGVVISVHDVETDELVGTLDKNTFNQRLQSLADTMGLHHYLDMEINEEGDAESSDVVFQYLVLGELVYG